MADMTSRLLTLCNSFTPPEVREVCLAAIKDMLMLWPQEMSNILTPALHRAHSNTVDTDNIGLGPFFPRRNVGIGPQLTSSANLKTVRPPRPFLQMSVPSSQLEAQHGQDPDYDKALHRYFYSYHGIVDLMVRLAVNDENLSKMLVDLSAMIGLDGVPIHFQLFPKLWTDIYHTPVRL
jgi:ubiquitin carboxyl-terminal hydrolase 34